MPSRRRRAPSDRTLLSTLQRQFGLDALRPGQREVIDAVLQGRDTVAVMPTGAGKSLCYQLPATLMHGVTIVVSPLIALMKDQAEKLDELGLPAEQMNSTLTTREEDAALGRIEEESNEFVFTTPERLTSPAFLDTLKGRAIDFVVVDEAHCLSEWGHDFRPAYLGLASALETLGRPPVLALTATATPEVITDVTRLLALRDPASFNAGIYRENLGFSVVDVDGEQEKDEAVVAALDETPGRAIVYAATIRAVEKLKPLLELAGHSVEAYHGRLPVKARKEAQERFMRGDVRVTVATNAFGMGIDAPDIRLVLHHDLPSSLEAYYQEAGRAGRDGEPARATLLFDPDDRRLHLFFQGGRYPSGEQLIDVHRALVEASREGPAPLAAVQAASSAPKNKVRPALHVLKDAGLVRERRGGRFVPVRAEVDEAELRAAAGASETRRAADRAKLEAMLDYGRAVDCRWQRLARYFEVELPVERCGRCDNCERPAESRIRPEALEALMAARREGAEHAA